MYWRLSKTLILIYIKLKRPPAEEWPVRQLFVSTISCEKKEFKIKSTTNVLYGIMEGQSGRNTEYPNV